MKAEEIYLQQIHARNIMLKSALVGYNVVADNGSIFIRLDVASQNLRNPAKFSENSNS